MKATSCVGAICSLNLLARPIGPVGVTYAATKTAHAQTAAPIAAWTYRYRYVANQGTTMIAKAGRDGKMYPTSLDRGREKKIKITTNQTTPRERNDDADACWKERQLSSGAMVQGSMPPSRTAGKNHTP